MLNSFIIMFIMKNTAANTHTATNDSDTRLFTYPMTDPTIPPIKTI